MSPNMLACIAVECISILRMIHLKGYVHGHVKPENIALGPSSIPKQRKLYLLDLSSAKKWREEESGNHIEYDQDPESFSGTEEFASVHAHLGRRTSRRDDLESLAYTLLFMWKGSFPWETFDSLYACKEKMRSLQSLCEGCPLALKKFVEVVISFEFEEEPGYKDLILMFEKEMGSVSTRPINTDSALQVIRSTCEVRGSTSSGKRTDVHQIWKALLENNAIWVSVYDVTDSMKQRYRHDIAESILAREIEEAEADGFYISSITSSCDTWTIIMNDKTAFTSQVCKQTAKIFPKEWVIHKWKNGYAITCAGGCNDNYLIVMSKGSQLKNQFYKTDKFFPMSWIKDQWKKGLYVTAMATAQKKWTVIMSENAGFTAQVVEFDFVFPLEGVRLRQKAGYIITSIASTSDQVAIILSKPLQQPLFGAQKILTTKYFPTGSIELGKYGIVPHSVTE